jgi:hypothetical protein
MFGIRKKTKNEYIKVPKEKIIKVFTYVDSNYVTYIDEDGQEVTDYCSFSYENVTEGYLRIWNEQVHGCRNQLVIPLQKIL